MNTLLRASTAIVTLLTINACGHSDYPEITDPPGILLSTAAPSITTGFTLNNRPIMHHEEPTFVGEEEFITHHSQLKEDVAKGEGAWLDEYINYYLPGDGMHRKRFIKELRERQFSRVFQEDKHLGWQQLLWVMRERVYLREINVAVGPTESMDCQAITAELERVPLYNTLQAVVQQQGQMEQFVDPTSKRTCAYFLLWDDDQLLSRLNRNPAAPAANATAAQSEIHQQLLQQLRHYAERVYHHQMLARLQPWTTTSDPVNNTSNRSPGNP